MRQLLLSKNSETNWVREENLQPLYRSATYTSTLKGHAWVHTKLSVSATVVVTVINITVSF